MEEVRPTGGWTPRSPSGASLATPNGSTSATGTFDAALVTFTLCTVDDPEAVLSEVRRVLKPGASLHFLEHGISDDPDVVKWQRRLEPLQRRFAGGCHLTRDPAVLAVEAGFSVTAVEQVRLPGGPRPFTEGFLGPRRTRREPRDACSASIAGGAARAGRAQRARRARARGIEPRQVVKTMVVRVRGRPPVRPRAR